MFISKVKYSFSVFALGTACALAPSMADADHAWGPYHWARTTSQFTLKLGNNLTTNQTIIQWLPLLYQTSSDWNSPAIFGAKSTPITTAVTAGQSKRNCSMVKGTTQVCNGKYGYNGWLGLATINIVDSVHITQGSAKMNDTYFNLAKYNNNQREAACDLSGNRPHLRTSPPVRRWHLTKHLHGLFLQYRSQCDQQLKYQTQCS